jgi:hypothetical protein
VTNWARRIKYMLFDTRRFGTLRDIENTDMYSLLLFMVEFPKWKANAGKPGERIAFADEVDWL